MWSIQGRSSLREVSVSHNELLSVMKHTVSRRLWAHRLGGGEG